MNPLVSVIIPVRNGAPTLGLCLEAAFQSSYPELEVIVVDDASCDNGAELARGFPCRIARLPAHAGASVARNVGARLARGSILFFTDADCLLEPEALARAVRALAAAGPGTAVGGTYTWLPHDRSFFSAFQSVFIRDAESGRPDDPDYLATHALAICIADFRVSGGFREDFLPMIEDVEFSHRLRGGRPGRAGVANAAGCRLMLDPAIEVRHIFNFTLRRSLANAFTKARYWTLYSLSNSDLLADSGTASHALKTNVVAWFACALFVAAFAATGAAGWLGGAMAVQAGNLWFSRRLLAAFRAVKGLRFALAATFYYGLVYPPVVGAGGLTGVMEYPAWARRRGPAA